MAFPIIEIWWEPFPPTGVALLRLVSCKLSLLHVLATLQVSLSGCSGFPPPPKCTFPNSNLTIIEDPHESQLELNVASSRKILIYVYYYVLFIYSTQFACLRFFWYFFYYSVSSIFQFLSLVCGCFFGDLCWIVKIWSSCVCAKNFSIKTSHFVGFVSLCINNKICFVLLYLIHQIMQM